MKKVTEREKDVTKKTWVAILFSAELNRLSQWILPPLFLHLAIDFKNKI